VQAPTGEEVRCGPSLWSRRLGKHTNNRRAAGDVARLSRKKLVSRLRGGRRNVEEHRLAWKRGSGVKSVVDFLWLACTFGILIVVIRSILCQL
jgi:hypothetical protein